MKKYYQSKKGSPKHQKYKETYSNHDLTEDTESFIDERYQLRNAKLSVFNEHKKSIEIANVKHLPTLFFIISILMLGMIMTKFICKTYLDYLADGLYDGKSFFKCITQYIGEETSTVKVIIKNYLIEYLLNRLS